MSTSDNFTVEINGTVVTDTDRQDDVFKKAMGKKDSEFLSVVVSRLSKGEEESM